MEEICRQLLEKTIAMILYKDERINYTSCKSDALIMFTDALIKYMTTVSRICADFTELSGRTFGSQMDILSMCRFLGIQIMQLEEQLMISKRVPLLIKDLSELERNESTVYTDGMTDEQEEKLKIYREWMAEDQPEEFPKYVPEHMPSYPDRHSYKRTPVYVHRETDPGKVREMSAEKNRFIQESLKNLIHECDNTVVNILGTDEYHVKIPLDPAADVPSFPVIHYERYLLSHKNHHAKNTQ